MFASNLRKILYFMLHFSYHGKVAITVAFKLTSTYKTSCQQLLFLLTYM